MSNSSQSKLQVATADFQKLQLDLQNVVEARQRLDAQLNENELVKKEFDNLTAENTVYKLIGTALVKQDQNEAKQNVDTRLDFIRGEIKRMETQLKDLQAKSEKKKSEIVELQTSIQQSTEQGQPTVPIAAA